MNVRSSVRQAAQAVRNSLAASWSDLRAVEATDILDTLKKEHTEIKQLLEQLSQADTSAQRKALVTKIKAALLPHTKAEEKVVYDAVISLRDKQAQWSASK
jgi:hemerythrin superfamily protein